MIVVVVWASELTAPYREHALQMNSLAIRGVKICDYYRFSILTLGRPDWNGMAELCALYRT